MTTGYQNNMKRFRFDGLRIYSNSIKEIDQNASVNSNEQRKESQISLKTEDDVPLRSKGMYDGLTPVMKYNEFDRLSDAFREIRTVSDWTLSTLHDQSPTIMNLETFENIASIEMSDDKTIVRREMTSKVKEDKIKKFFQLLPSLSDLEFLEEFRFTIISSNILNDINGYRFKFDVKKSILDFHKSSKSDAKMVTTELYCTKYGICSKLSKNTFMLQRTFNHSGTILACLKLIRYLSSYKTKNEISNKVIKFPPIKILSLIIICIHLSFQQEYFFNQCIKYKFMIKLKETIQNLQKTDDLIHKYYDVYNEHSIYKPILRGQLNKKNRYQGNGSSKNFMEADDKLKISLNKINELVTSTSDFLFHQMMKYVNDLLPLINKTELLKYCEIYSIELPTLYEYIYFPTSSLQEKLKRLEELKKFMFTCLLSITDSKITVTDGEEVINQLNNLFGKAEDDINLHKMQTAHLVDKFIKACKILSDLNDALSPILYTLLANRNILYQAVDSFDDSLISSDYNKETEDESKNYNIINILNHTKTLEKNLLRLSSKDLANSESMDFITRDISSILELWTSLVNRNGNAKKEVKNRNLSVLSKRFSIDICKTLEDSSAKLPNSSNILKDKIDFKQIDDNSNEFLDVENLDDNYKRDDIDNDLVFTNENSYCATYDQTVEWGGSKNMNILRELTDDELKKKLDQKISKLAAENRKVKEKIRTQKSFELLRMQKKKSTINAYQTFKNLNCENTRSRPSKLRNYSSEETIPIIYELKELFNAKA